MLVDHRLAPAFRKNFTSICLYSWVEKGVVEDIVLLRTHHDYSTRISTQSSVC